MVKLAFVLSRPLVLLRKVNLIPFLCCLRTSFLWELFVRLLAVELDVVGLSVMNSSITLSRVVIASIGH